MREPCGNMRHLPHYLLPVLFVLPSSGAPEACNSGSRERPGTKKRVSRSGGRPEHWESIVDLTIRRVFIQGCGLWKHGWSEKFKFTVKGSPAEGSCCLVGKSSLGNSGFLFCLRKQQGLYTVSLAHDL